MHTVPLSIEESQFKQYAAIGDRLCVREENGSAWSGVLDHFGTETCPDTSHGKHTHVVAVIDVDAADIATAWELSGPEGSTTPERLLMTMPFYAFEEGSVIRLDVPDAPVFDDLDVEPDGEPRLIHLDIRVTDQEGTTKEAHLQAEGLDSLVGQLGTFESWLEMHADSGPARTSLFDASEREGGA